MTRGPSSPCVETQEKSGQIRTADTLNYKPELGFCTPNIPHINCAIPQNMHYFKGSKNGFHKTSIRTLGLSTVSLKRHSLDVMSITVYFEAMKMTWVVIMSWTILLVPEVFHTFHGFSVYSCVRTRAYRDTVDHPYIHTCSCGTHLLTLFLYFS